MDVDYVDEEGEGGYQGRRGVIAIVVAEQWIACVHCSADNPPNAARCEVCFGTLARSTADATGGGMQVVL